MSESLPPDHFHPEELMDALVAGGVHFILIGGLAVGVHGVVRATRDMDIVPDPDPANLTRLAAVLGELDAEQIGVDTEVLSGKLGAAVGPAVARLELSAEHE